MPSLNVFSHFLRPGKQGGVEVYFKDLCAGLKNTGAEIKVVTSGHSGIGGRFVAEQKDLLALGDGKYLFPNYFVPPLKGSRQEATVVIHDLLFRAFPKSLPSAKVAWLNVVVPLSLARSDRVIAISEFTKASVLKAYGRVLDESKITVVHNPINLSRFTKCEEVSLPEGITKPFVLCAASGFWHKNVPFLISLFSRERALRDYQLVLVGKRPSDMGWSASKADFRYSFDRIVETSPVVSLGYVGDQLLGELYRQASAVAFPSLYEGFGMPALEARGLGANVVANPVGALPEFLDEGIFIPNAPSSAHSWTEALLKALSSERPLQPDWLANGRLQPTCIGHQYLAACGF